MSSKSSNCSLLIFLIALILAGADIPASAQAQSINFSEWKATSGPFDSQDIITFYPGETAYAWTQAFNGGSERIKIKAFLYRANPDSFLTFLGEKELEIDPGNTTEILMETWSIPQNPVYGYYNYSSNFYVYKASNGELLEQGETPEHTLYRIESGFASATLRIQFLNASYKPVSEASVYVDGIPRGFTDTSGCLMLNVSPVTHTISVKKEGYNEVTQTVYDIKGRQINDVKIYHRAPHAPYLIEPSDVVTEGITSFTWEAIPTANLYRIQVSRTKEFLSKALDSSTYSNCYSTILSEGAYYWRVRAENNFNTSPWSSTRSLKINPSAIKCDIYFFTNPSTTYITISGEDISNGTEAIYPYGTYTIKANAPLGYTFYDWIVNGNLSISSSNSAVTNVSISGGGTCIITANFKSKNANEVPVLFVTNAPNVTILHGEEIEFPVNLTNEGMFCDAKLWFKSLPGDVVITDNGGFKTIDSGGSTSFNVKIKANQTAIAGNYILEVAGDAKNVTHNWQALILRVVTSRTSNQTSSSFVSPTPNKTATASISPAQQPTAVQTNTSAPTPSTETKSIAGFGWILAFTGTIIATWILRRKS